MSVGKPYVAVDWGTSLLRAWLCNSDSEASEPLVGPGISQLTDSPADTLLSLIAPWVDEWGPLDLLLGGMAGSNIGWREAPYLACPLRPTELAADMLEFEERGHRVRIVPGVSCTNALGQPDVMRGEEVQVLGWLGTHDNDSTALLCLPGTHTKWVKLRNGRIESFTTTVTGELFALLRDRSVLVTGGAAGSGIDDENAFLEGVRVAADDPANLLHLLFSTRSRALLEPDTSGDASSYLSGLLIGADIRMALNKAPRTGEPIGVIGGAELCERFALAMKELGVDGRSFDGDEMVLAGFMKLSELSP